jgi:hypothetical protein
MIARRQKRISKLTPKEIALIIELSSPETNQDVIARMIGRTSACVGKYQREHNLPRPMRGVRHQETSCPNPQT